MKPACPDLDNKEINRTLIYRGEFTEGNKAGGFHGGVEHNNN